MPSVPSSLDDAVFSSFDDAPMAVSMLQTLAVLSNFDASQVPAQPVANTMLRHTKVSWNMRGAWLLQEAARACDPQDEACAMESTKVIVMLVSLCSMILLVFCAFTFFREDKEEQITPLCPQLVVKETELKFKLPFATQGDNVDVLSNKDPPDVICKVSMDWPDPFRGSPHGVAATVRLHNRDMTLATVVARNVAVLGQGLALCRTGCEIFGFVEPDGDKYHVKHRTGVHLLTLLGNFDDWDVEGFNPVGSKVCSMKKVKGECHGKVTQHVDAGLVICSLMATHVHRRLTVNAPPWPAAGLNFTRPMIESASDSRLRGDAAEPTLETPAPALTLADPPLFTGQAPRTALAPEFAAGGFTAETLEPVGEASKPQ